MNKYMGFYELKYLGIPTVQWELFENTTILDKEHLWTIRVAVESGYDFNLPRVVGVSGEEAYDKGKQLLEKYEGKGMVVFYPYFIAEKSGVVDVSSERIVIEGVKGDLWNLVTHGKKDVTIVLSNDSLEFHGDENLLAKDELDEVLGHAGYVKGKYRECLAAGKSVLLEWSYAYHSDVNHQPIGEKYLVFYELRTIE
jgi:hypothetical protein